MPLRQIPADPRRYRQHRRGQGGAEGSTDIPTHFWSLVNIGEGWYHFDCTPRKDVSTFFYLTDAELEAYSSTHNGTHVYDKSLYPED